MDRLQLLTPFTKENCSADKTLMPSLHRIYNTLNKTMGCTYFSYILESEQTSKKIQVASNDAWANHFYFENLVQHCHIANAIRSISKKQPTNSTLIWDHIKPHSTKSKIILGLRDDFSVTHGITFTTFLLNPLFGVYLEMISFAGEKLDLSFYKELLQNKKHVGSLIYPLRRLGYQHLTQINALYCQTTIINAS